MTVGSSVGSWRFTLGALRGLMPILATYVAAPTERRCGAKLHWRVIPVGLLKGNGNGHGSFTITFVILITLANVDPIYSAICMADCKSTGFWVRTQACTLAERPSTNRNIASASFTSVH